MYFLCGIYRYIEFAADYAYGLYVVGVVVGYILCKSTKKVRFIQKNNLPLLIF